MEGKKMVARICAVLVAVSMSAADALPAFAAAELGELTAGQTYGMEEDVADREMISIEDIEENIAEPTEPELEPELPEDAPESEQQLPEDAPESEQQLPEDAPESKPELYDTTAPELGPELFDGTEPKPEMFSIPEPREGEGQETVSGMQENSDGLLCLDGALYNGYYMDSAGILYFVANGVTELTTGTVSAGTEYYSASANRTMTLPEQTVFVEGKAYNGYYMDSDGILYTVSDGRAEAKTGAVGAGKEYYSYKDTRILSFPERTVFVEGKVYTGYYLSQGKKMYRIKNGISVLKTGMMNAGAKYYSYAEKKTLALPKQTLYVKGKVYTGYYLSQGKKMYRVKQGTRTLKSGMMKAGAKYYSYNANKTLKISKQTLYVKGKVYTGYYLSQGKKMYHVKQGARTLKTGTVKAGTKYFSYNANKTLKISKQTLYVKGKVYTGYYLSKGKKMYHVKQGTCTLASGMLGAGTKYYSYAEKKTLTLSKQMLYVNGKVYTGYYMDSEHKMYHVNAGICTPANEALNAGTEYYSSATGAMQALPQQTVYVNGKAMEGMSAESLATLQRAQAVVASITNDSMTREEKLKVCFDYVKTYREGRPRTPHYMGMDWPVVYANDMFVNGRGNCCSYAAAFAYMAKAIGYDEVYCCNDSGHGWTEIDGLIYDPEWSMHHHVYSYYALSYDTKTDVNYKGNIAAGLPWMRIKI